MTNDTVTSDASYSNPHDDPMFLSNSDLSAMELGNTKFSGKNFLSWSRCVVMALVTKNKQGFLTGVVAMPALTSPKYSQWIRCDYMVRCWLLNSIDHDLKENFITCKSAKSLWTDLCERYGQSNAPLFFQLKKELRNISQENDSVVEYFTKLKRHWDDIDDLEAIPECDCGAMAKCSCNLYKKMLDLSVREKVLNFLMGLSDAYEHPRSNILAMDPLPPLNKVYSIIQQIESQKLISHIVSPSQDVSALNASRAAGHGKGPWNVWKRDDKKEEKKSKADDRWCYHCNKKGHLPESCFIKFPELKAKFLARFSGNAAGGSMFSQPTQDFQYPVAPSVSQYGAQYAPQYSQNQNQQSFVAAAQHQQHQHDSQSGFLQQHVPQQATPVQFDPAMLTALYNHMMQIQQAKNDSPVDFSDASVNFAGITLANQKACDICKDAWIIDSGATDHMTGHKHYFDCLELLRKPILIGLPDGSSQLVTYGGHITLESGIRLHNVLYVPAFKHNLLSVGKLLSTTQLLIRFFVDKCVIQDPASSIPVGVGLQERGLF
ncbi:uncharacterized protein LOC141612925 [Silene latifolia]|uniref:uncharacterized protein LOC141612925 n=1 Tax=Silene latifolia TaxID=37657 RepID=UPI003D76D36D